MNRILRATRALYVGHVLTYLRSRTAIYWTLAFPLFFMLIFGLVFGRGHRADFNQLMPGLMTITVISGSLFGVSMRMVTERESGVLRRYRLTPLGPLSIVLAHGATGLTTLCFAVLVQLLAARLVFGFTVSGSPVVLALVVVLSGLAMIPIGLVVGSVARDTKVAPAMSNFMFFPLMFLSGAAIPFAILPEWLQRIARLLPTTYIVESLQGVVIRGVGLLGLGLPAVILVCTAAIGITLNALLFRWESTEPVKVKRLLLALFALVAVYGAGYLIEPTLHIAERMVR